MSFDNLYSTEATKDILFCGRVVTVLDGLRIELDRSSPWHDIWAMSIDFSSFIN